MLLRDLKKVWISRAEETDNFGEPKKTWKYIGVYSTIGDVENRTVEQINDVSVNELQNPTRGVAYLNLQQDVNELDRKSSGEVDYSIYKARTTKQYNIQKGDGVSLSDISKAEEIIPDYRVTDIIKIGNAYMYRLVKYNGQN